MRVTILTGAGISAESGLGTFRDAGGLWTRYPLEEVATPEGWRRDPAKVLAFYDARRAQAAAIAHQAQLACKAKAAPVGKACKSNADEAQRRQARGDLLKRGIGRQIKACAVFACDFAGVVCKAVRPVFGRKATVANKGHGVSPWSVGEGR